MNRRKKKVRKITLNLETFEKNIIIPIWGFLRLILELINVGVIILLFIIACYLMLFRG